MTIYRSQNPYSGELYGEYPLSDYPNINQQHEVYRTWRKTGLNERIQLFEKLIQTIRIHEQKLALLITQEMGKPVHESLSEIRKCVLAVEYYCENAEAILKPELIPTEARESRIQYDPIGIIMGIMPWNFPFWQFFRFAVPTLIAGNSVLLKHAPNVPQCAAAIEDLFRSCGFPHLLVTNFFLSNDMAAQVLADPFIAGLSFTGSDRTGSQLASLAGKHLKRSVLELGGNDPFIVLEDASIEDALKAAITSRCINGGQACNGAKRFILHKNIADEFCSKLIQAVHSLKTGDPMDPNTRIGPLARPDLAKRVREQILESVKQGAVIHHHHQMESGDNNFVDPVVLTETRPGMLCWEEEVFGPVWSVCTAATVQEALELANRSRYGLGAAIWTNNRNYIDLFVNELESGNVFVNDFVRSDPRLPFGGVKNSGYGRELSASGMMEFVNQKTVYIK